jgi:hypothetical protein
MIGAKKTSKNSISAYSVLFADPALPKYELFERIVELSSTGEMISAADLCREFLIGIKDLRKILRQWFIYNIVDFDCDGETFAFPVKDHEFYTNPSLTCHITNKTWKSDADFFDDARLIAKKFEEEFSEELAKFFMPYWCIEGMNHPIKRYQTLPDFDLEMFLYGFMKLLNVAYNNEDLIDDLELTSRITFRNLEDDDLN